MDRGLRIVLGFGILLAGIAVAMVFRQPSPRARPSVPDLDDSLVLRQESEPPVAEPTTPPRADSLVGRPPAPPYVGVTPGRATGSLAPISGGEPPPSLAKSYPGFPGENASSTGRTTDAEARPGNSSTGPVRTHQIVDGDTLRDLAERYLGDEGRYLEIYRANRDVLASPEVLPIGVELRIPPRRTQAHSRPTVTPEEPLVPVAPAPSSRAQPSR